MAFEYEWWEYALIPFIAGIVGYATNVVALHLTFYPLEFVGIEIFRLENQPWGLFGWQGIIPTKAEKMASTCFDLMTRRYAADDNRTFDTVFLVNPHTWIHSWE